MVSLVSKRETDPSPRASGAHRDGSKLGRKGEGDAMRLARVEPVVWGFILDPLREESQVRQDKETLRVAVTPGLRGKTSKLSCRIFWELHRGGNFADPLSKAFPRPSRKQ